MDWLIPWLFDSGAARHFFAVGSLVLWVFACGAMYAVLERAFPGLLLANSRPEL